MLIPRKTKKRFNFCPKYGGHAKGNQFLVFGEFGLRTKKGSGVYISNRQIEAMRKVISRFVKKNSAKMWIRIFPHWGKTQKPSKVRMGSGKGSVESWVAVVKENTIIFEISLRENKKKISPDSVCRILKQAAHKLPKKGNCQYEVIKKESQVLNN